MFAIPVAEYASFSHQARTLKTNLLYLTSNFSKFFHIFFLSHVFTALEFDASHFGILLCEIVKPLDHNEIKPPIGKSF